MHIESPLTLLKHMVEDANQIRESKSMTRFESGIQRRQYVHPDPFDLVVECPIANHLRRNAHLLLHLSRSFLRSVSTFSI